MIIMMDSFGLASITIIFSLLIYIYAKVRKIYSYFKDRGIPYVPATFPFGSNIKSDLFLMDEAEANDLLYKEVKTHKVVGFYKYLKPLYFVCDPEYANRIFVNDFSYFHDRVVAIDDEDTNPLDANLFFLSGEKWRYLRHKLSPIFTTAKLRSMYDEMYKYGDHFLIHFERHDGKEVDVQEDLQCFSIDVIGSTVFGLDIDSINNPNTEFRLVGNRSFDLSAYESFMIEGKIHFPQLIQKFKLTTTPRMVCDFFLSVTKQNIESRKKSGVIRKDIVQLLIELQQTRTIKGEAEDKNKDDSINVFTDNVIAAQSYAFFVSGYHKPSSILYFLLYLFSKYPECQNKAREEIKKLKLNKEKIEFDELNNLKYLDNCISETLRVFPTESSLTRICTKNYTFPNGTRIEKGSTVIIPNCSIQKDAEYFPDPDVFNPDRFKTTPKPGTYAPFGIGPRMCIGQRFAVTEIKMAAARILDAFEIEKSDLTIEPIKFKASSFTASTINPLYIKIKKSVDIGGA